jgi:hypothetical protein
MARINKQVMWPTEVECVAEEHHRFTADALWIRLEVEEAVAWRVDTRDITCPEDGSRVEALPGQGQEQ